MTEMVQLVVFVLDGQRYGLRPAVVERVIRAVEVVPLPTAPEMVLGVIDLAGRIVPVLNVRGRLQLPEREMGLDDQIVIANTTRRTVALLVDSVPALVEVPIGDVTKASKIVPGVDYIDGVAKLDDGMLYIHDLEKFLSLREEQELQAALARG